MTIPQDPILCISTTITNPCENSAERASKDEIHTSIFLRIDFKIFSETHFTKSSTPEILRESEYGKTSVNSAQEFQNHMKVAQEKLPCMLL